MVSARLLLCGTEEGWRSGAARGRGRDAAEEGASAGKAVVPQKCADLVTESLQVLSLVPGEWGYPWRENLWRKW